jgi:hypothetical protein
MSTRRDNTANINVDIPAADEQRVVRIPMALALIRDLDRALVARAGGYTTRAEFITDAVRDRLLELEFEPAPAEPSDTSQAVSPPDRRPALNVVQPTDQPHDPPTAPQLEDTVLAAPARGFSLDGEAIVHDAPLFGLHNRDFASLWALHALASITEKKAEPLGSALDRVTDRAWEFSARLRPFDAGADLKLTSLFPTNRAKAQSASGQFRAFAVGTVRQTEGQLYADGPLFVWRAVQAVETDGVVEIGLTDTGWQLLGTIDGISLRLPHGLDLTRRFLAYLATYAPADLAGFVHGLRSAGERMQRGQLVDVYRAAYPTWTDSQASTNAAGYVARGREWGLIEPKLIERRYRLTADGDTWLAEHEGGGAR